MEIPKGVSGVGVYQKEASICWPHRNDELSARCSRPWSRKYLPPTLEAKRFRRRYAGEHGRVLEEGRLGNVKFFRQIVWVKRRDTREYSEELMPCLARKTVWGAESFQRLRVVCGCDASRLGCHTLAKEERGQIEKAWRGTVAGDSRHFSCSTPGFLLTGKLQRKSTESNFWRHCHGVA